ncbi:MarR family winged helix-turn-helix transcriptional regulator [Herbiconiux solani]|uniref:MarR family winged helix-turn-helix transcriptional regulator n=1 Tax=Herbiconiux solani TaxID=661329 RepID=UPI000824EA77|nr:MarR family transcriptional regulator [Herbiconiux solani]
MATETTTATGSPSPLDDMACFALYSASNAVAQAHRAALAPWNLTYTQYIALVELAADRDGLTVGALGSRLGLDSGTLSPMLRRLEERGLVIRARSRDDERVVTVSLTDEGRSVRAELAEAVSCLTPAYGLGSLDELRSLVASLHGIAEGMRELTAATRA